MFHNHLGVSFHETSTSGLAAGGVMRSEDTEMRSNPSKGQAIKSAGRMPWRQEPKKDGVSTEMPRGVASRHRSVDVRMGKPTTFNGVVSLPEQNRVRKVTEGTETSKYLEERKSNEIP